VSCRILLVGVNSQYIHTNGAIPSLARAVDESGYGFMLDVAEYSVNLPVLSVMGDICRLRPEAIAFSVYIWNIAYIAPMIRDLKQLLPETQIFLGGPEAQGRALYYLESLPIDGIFIGEGEESFPAWVKAWARKDKKASIPGLLRRGEEDSFIPARRPPLSELPFPYLPEYIQGCREEKRVVYYEASRGCPYKCSFCSSASEPLRERPLDMVLSELPLLAELNGQVKFVDRTFNAAPSRAKAILRKLLELYRPGLSWHCELSPFKLDPELVELFISAPEDYFHLELGVQTLNPAALAAVGRHGNWDEAEPTVKRLLEAGNCHIHLDLIAGLPEDDPDSFAHSFHRLHQLNPEYLQLGFLKVLPGSILAEQADDYGLIWESDPPYRILSTPKMGPYYLFSLFKTERMFNALYNRTQEFRPRLIAEAERRGNALSIYEEAADLHPGYRGLSQQEKVELVNQLCR